MGNAFMFTAVSESSYALFYRGDREAVYSSQG